MWFFSFLCCVFYRIREKNATFFFVFVVFFLVFVGFVLVFVGFVLFLVLLSCLLMNRVNGRRRMPALQPRRFNPPRKQLTH